MTVRGWDDMREGVKRPSSGEGDRPVAPTEDGVDSGTPDGFRLGGRNDGEVVGWYTVGS